MYGSAEDRDSLIDYARHWNIVESAALPWRALPYRARKKKGKPKDIDKRDIIEHLYEQAKSHKGCSQFEVLRATLTAHKLSIDGFASFIASRDLGNRNLLVAESSMYIALYYSKVSGTFSIDNFADNYRSANNF